MTGIADKFPDIAFVSFGGADHALASSGMRPERGRTRPYDLKLRAAVATRIETLHMRPKLAGERVGDAPSGKMLRSAVMKGLEALMAECLLAAARRAGVEKVFTTRRGFGSPHWMSCGTVGWQKKLASLNVDPDEDDLAKRADAVLSKL